MSGDRDRWSTDPERVQGVVVDANDGIIATAGIVEGFIGAGAGSGSVVVAATAALVAGGMALGAAKFTEVAAARDSQLARIEEERRQLALSPDEEFDELVEYHLRKGLSPSLAREVAKALTDIDPLAAHVEAEFGLRLDRPLVQPLREAVLSAGAFVVGAGAVLLVVLLTPRSWLVTSTFGGVVVAIALTSVISGIWGKAPIGRTLARTLTVALGAMGLTYLAGSLIL